jgi:hypothetical protein
MAKKKQLLQKDQESLADALFPAGDEFEEAILSIPPEKRILRTEHYDFSVSALVRMMEDEEVKIPEYQRRYVWTDRQASRLVESLSAPSKIGKRLEVKFLYPERSSESPGPRVMDRHP